MDVEVPGPQLLSCPVAQVWGHTCPLLGEERCGRVAPVASSWWWREGGNFGHCVTDSGLTRVLVAVSGQI